jgi:hypothetical protein
MQTKMPQTANMWGKEFPAKIAQVRDVPVSLLQKATEVSLTYAISSGESGGFSLSLQSVRSCLQLAGQNGKTP